MHYGLAWDPTVTVEQAGRQFQSVFRALGELQVPTHIQKVKDRLHISFDMS